MKHFAQFLRNAICLKKLFENQISSRTISFLYLYTGHNPGNNLTPAGWRNSTWTVCPTIKLALYSTRWFTIRWQLRVYCISLCIKGKQLWKVLSQWGGPTLIHSNLCLALREFYIAIFLKACKVGMGVLLNLAIVRFILG